ncbi:MAG: DUF1127 domain-containing protein [Paracoccaceae bacterium]
MTNVSCMTAPRVARRPQTGLWPLLARWADVRRQRAHLAALDDGALNDIGVTRKQARREARKPFWMMPFFR